MDKTCYVVTFYLGERRKTVSQQKDDVLFFLKQQIAHLSYFKHNLKNIIFVFNVEKSHEKYFKHIRKLVPSQIQNTEVQILKRKNIGFSYGGWSDVYNYYKDKFDYYIFNEDDYFFTQHNWDNYLVKKYQSYPDCGYLCPMVREPNHWNGYRKYAGHSSGIASNESLQKVTDKYGKLPYNEDKTYQGGEDIQILFSFAFLEVGLNIYDFRDDYALDFAWTEPGEIQIWNLWQWNDKELIIPAIKLYNNNLHWYKSTDGEFLENFKSTTLKKATKCYNNKVTYYGESNKKKN